jgi:hypothetical protein
MPPLFWLPVGRHAPRDSSDEPFVQRKEGYGPDKSHEQYSQKRTEDEASKICCTGSKSQQYVRREFSVFQPCGVVGCRSRNWIGPGTRNH